MPLWLLCFLPEPKTLVCARLLVRSCCWWVTTETLAPVQPSAPAQPYAVAAQAPVRGGGARASASAAANPPPLKVRWWLRLAHLLHREPAQTVVVSLGQRAGSCWPPCRSQCTVPQYLRADQTQSSYCSLSNVMEPLLESYHLELRLNWFYPLSLVAKHIHTVSKLSLVQVAWPHPGKHDSPCPDLVCNPTTRCILRASPRWVAP